MYRLRWYFDYLNRPPYYGGWDSTDPRKPAWSHAFEGLARAMIEGKDGNGKIKVLAEIPGQDFQNFQWIAETSASPLSIKHGLKLPSRLVGLMIQHRYGQVQVFRDGSVVRNGTTYDKINFASYGR